MQDRVSNDIGAPDSTLNWETIEWPRAEQRVKTLRQRIFRATQAGQWNRVRSLKKLLLRSHANLLVSIRRVTQENHGKNTPGVDGRRATTPEARTALVSEMQEYSFWQVKPARRIYIPKANGKQRPLGIPTIRDRIAQAVLKNALEPEWEARFETNSYGFRPGRGCHDAIEQVWVRLNAQAHDAWVLDADIQGAFDNISHAALMRTLGPTPGRGWIQAWLRAGYVEAGHFHATESGTPQGGIISPLLANVALDGMERWLEGFTATRVSTVHSGPSAGRMMRRTVKAYGCIRYADDFVVTAPTREALEALRPQLAAWLAERGLRLSDEKTSIRQKTDGFNFLGFTIRSYGGKCLVTPQKEKVRAKLRESKEWLYAHPNIAPDGVMAHVNPMLRGWANYYRHAVSKRAFATFDHHMVQMLIRWAKRRHPNKRGRWIVARYFGTLGRDQWVFKAKTLTRRGKLVDCYLYRLAQTRITRHVKVHGNASPDDPALADYWAQRRTRLGQTYYRPGTKRYRIAQQQRWTCPFCHQHLFIGEQLHLHHVEAVARGGNDEAENLRLVHVSCHRLIHERDKQVCAAGGLEPYDG